MIKIEKNITITINEYDTNLLIDVCEIARRYIDKSSFDFRNESKGLDEYGYKHVHYIQEFMNKIFEI